MNAQETVDAWLDAEEKDKMRLAKKELGLNVLHVIWEQESNSIGLVTTCEDPVELAELLEHCAKRCRNGEHVATRREVRL